MPESDRLGSAAQTTASDDLADDVITIRYADDDPAEGEKGFFGGSQQAVMRITDVNQNVLGANLTSFCKQIVGLVENVSASPESHAFTLEQFEVTVEVSAGGEIRMIGSVNTQIKGGLKLVFGSRKEH